MYETDSCQLLVIFDESLHATSPSAVIKCRKKSECLPASHIHACTEKLREILPNLRESLEKAVSHSEIGHIERDLSLLQSPEIPHTLVSVIPEEANSGDNTHTLDEVLNSLEPFDNEPPGSDIYNSFPQNLFDSRQQSSESTANNIQESEDNTSISSVSHVTQSLSEIQDKLDEHELRRALDATLSRVSYLKTRSIEESDKFLIYLKFLIICWIWV